MRPLEPTFDFGTFPNLQTDRLVLRGITSDDADAIMVIKGDYAVTRYNGGQPYHDRSQALALIERVEKGYANQASIRWGITLKPDPFVIGMICYNEWIRADYRASIGFDLARACWGHSIMPEAARAILEFGFSAMALNRVEADTDVENIASMRVLQKLGFRNEGFQLQKHFEDGIFHDMALFALLRRDYLSS